MHINAGIECFRYENPFVTASSRLILADISSLTRRLSQFDIPRPVAMLHTLFGLQRSKKGMESWIRALDVWTEVDEILESDSFDGHQRTIVEHTLHILFLPGLHSDGAVRSCGPNLVASDSHEQCPQLSITTGSELPRPIDPVLAFAGIGLPSPFHFQLHIITRLSLNEQGRIVHHRDFWDVKDLLGLVPGAPLTQWISTRLTGYTLAGISRIVSRIIGKGEVEEDDPEREIVRKGGEAGRRPRSNSDLTQAAAYARHIQIHGHIPFNRG